MLLFMVLWNKKQLIVIVFEKYTHVIDLDWLYWYINNTLQISLFFSLADQFVYVK